MTCTNIKRQDSSRLIAPRNRFTCSLAVSLLAAMVALAPMSSATGADGQAAPQQTSDSQRQDLLRRTIEHDGIEREYFVHVPPGRAGRLPVVVGIHGYTSTATGFALSHGVNRHADEHGYIAVFPQGSHFLANNEQGQSWRVTSWNDLAANLGPKNSGPHCTAESDRYPCPAECGTCNRCAWTSCHDDVGFIDKMLHAVAAEFEVDVERQYLLGVSNGGMLTLRLACNLSDRFAAVAPIIAQLAPGYDCGPSVDLPMLHLFGGEDNTVRFDGKPAGDGFMYTSAADTATTWAAALACETGPSDWDNSIAEQAGLQCTAYSNCRVDGHAVVSCMDPDGGHEWPEQYSGDLPATCVTAEQYASMPGQAHCAPASGEYVHLGMDLIWQFMSRYRRQP